MRSPRAMSSLPPHTADTNADDVKNFSTQDVSSTADVASDGDPNDGRRKFAAIKSNFKKVKPGIVNRRISKLKTYEGTEKDIRHSPWRLNLICQLSAGLPLLEAIKQLEFCEKSFAPLVQRVLQRTSNLADIRHGIQQCQLEVAECFATQGHHLKRMKIHGKGRVGVMHHKHSHMRVILREIDFPLKIYQAPTLNQKRKWVQLQIEAREEFLNAKKERDELLALKQEGEKKRNA
jgi:ribosomal protein L22